MKTSLIICALFIGICFTSEFDDKWKALNQNSKTPFASKQEEAYRRGICEKNMAKIKKHNAEADLGKYAYKMGLNKFCMLTRKEFKQQYLSGMKIPDDAMKVASMINQTESQIMAMQAARPPTTLDLRTTGGIGSIRDQGACGSCWAFSAVATIEFAYWKKRGSLEDCSEQHLVDCVYSRSGCDGGWMPDAFNYIKNTGGIFLESGLPYKAEFAGCGSSGGLKIAQLSRNRAYVQVFPDEATVKNTLYTQGVLSVAVDASRWNSYMNGIYQDPIMSTQAPQYNHAVALVGYGNENGIPYYIIKNSWGASWGEAGYMKMDARRYPNGNTYSGLRFDFVFYPSLA